MHEESNFVDRFKKNPKRSKAPPCLCIPDPLDLFKLDVINRPPSVPILGRRFSSESLLNNKEGNSPLLNSKIPRRPYRRKSIPDRLHKKSSISHKKLENKLKPSQKYPETKPPLDKSSKLLKYKSSKNLIRKLNINTPQINKNKKIVNKGLVGDFIEKRRFDNNTPNKVLKKSGEWKECEEVKKSHVEPRNLIVKHTSDPFAKVDKLKSIHKSSRSALSLRFEENLPKRKNKKSALNGQDHILSSKKKSSKKSDAERSSSQSKITKKSSKPKKTVKKGRKNSSEATNKHSKEGKKVMKKSKISKPVSGHKQEMPEKWLEHSFFETKNKQVESLEFDDNLYEDPINYFMGSDFQSSNEIHLNFSIPSTDDRLSKISSVPVLSVPESANNRPKSPIPPELDKSNRVKILKKTGNFPSKSEQNAAILIQKVFRGYRDRKLLKENLENLKEFNENSFFSYKSHKKLVENSNRYSTETRFRPQNSIEEFHCLSEENADKSDYQAPKPAEIQIDPHISSPVNSAVLLKMTELTKRLKQEQKNYEILERDSKEMENLLYLDTLKQKKANIEDLRKRDLEAIKKLTPNNGSESEIFGIFQNIINRRYETINSMFDENIKAVQEALAQSVFSEESFSVKVDERAFRVKDIPLQTSETVTLSAGLGKAKAKECEVASKEIEREVCVSSVDFKNIKEKSNYETRFYNNLGKANTKQITEVRIQARSPEINESYVVFKSTPQVLKPITQDPEIMNFKPQQKLESEKLGHSSRIVWIDEVAMPSNIDLTDLIIESSISDLYEQILSDIIDDLFKIPPKFIQDLSEELITAILLHEIQEQVQEMRKDYDEESILSIIQKVFIKTQNLIVSELLKPLEKDPLVYLSEIQEAEIGCGFLPEEKYAMLNLEAFQDDLSHQKAPIRIFNTMVFDCINECLEKLIVKEDLPWASTRYKKVLVRTSEDVINYIVNRLVRFSEIKAGEIAYEDVGNEAKRSEKIVSQKREVDIVKMLAIEVGEDEMEWIRYDKEELQVRLDLADMILEGEIDVIVDLLFNQRP